MTLRQTENVPTLYRDTPELALPGLRSHDDRIRRIKEKTSLLTTHPARNKRRRWWHRR